MKRFLQNGQTALQLFIANDQRHQESDDIVVGGQISYNNQVISGSPVHQVVDLGITLVPEGRQLFPKMTVEENLLVGAYLGL